MFLELFIENCVKIAKKPPEPGGFFSLTETLLDRYNHYVRY
jgi:hypothetical protein